MNLGDFHFLRPLYLLLLLPAAFVIWGIVKREDYRGGLQALIAPHLLEHILVGRKRQRALRPLYFLALFWGIAIFALAGPSWQREASPFVNDSAGLVIVLKVTPDMLAQDIQPSRLRRAIQKIHDLLKLRPGAKTALIAYAGSSHLVMPLTSDPAIIEMFSRALDPKIMPIKGDAPLKALREAAALLRESNTPGSILLIADDIPKGEIAPLKDFYNKEKITVHILAMAAPKEVDVPPGGPRAPALDLPTMKQAAAAAGSNLVLVTPDGLDVQRLAAAVESSMTAAQEEEGERWKDGGYLLMPLLVLLGLLFFRRGWVVSYE